MTQDAGRDDSPYKGLQPYTEADRQYFFGRERDREIIISNLFASPLTVFYGASGVGKSSVLLAGVVPELKATPRLAVVVFREWQDAGFESALKKEVLRAVGESAQKEIAVDARLEFDEFLLACIRAFRGSLFFVLDQFEEYFLYHPDSPLTDKFDAAFARAVNRQDVDANFLLSMRDDGLSKLDRFQKRIPNLLNNMLRLEHLDRASASEAIRRPLDKYNELHANGRPRVGVEEGLVSALLVDLAAGKVTLDLTGQGKVELAAPGERPARIETPFLQLVLTRLWDEEEAAHDHPDPRKLRLATYERLGRATTIVRTHLDKMMETERLAPYRDAAAALFHFLVTPGGQKIAHTPADLASYTNLPSAEVGAVLNELSHPDARILRPIAPPPDQPGALRYEIFHDVLAPAILDWRARYMQKVTEEEAARSREAAETKAREERDRAEREARSARRLRWVTAVLALVTLFALGSTAYAYVMRQQAARNLSDAEAARREASANRKVAEEQSISAGEAQRRATAANEEAKSERDLAEQAKAEAAEAKAGAEAARESAAVALSQAVAAKAKADEAITISQLMQNALADYQGGDKSGAVAEYLKLIPYYQRAGNVCQEAAVRATLGKIQGEAAEATVASPQTTYYDDAEASLTAALQLYGSCQSKGHETLSAQADVFGTLGEIHEHTIDPMDESEGHERVANYYETAAQLYAKAGEHGREKDMLGRLVEMYESSSAPDSQRATGYEIQRLKLTEDDRERADLTKHVGELYAKADKKTEADEYYRQAARLYQELYRQEPQMSTYQSAAASALVALGDLHATDDRAAINDYQAALKIFESTDATGPKIYVRDRATIHVKLARLYAGDDKPKAAENYGRALDLYALVTQDLYNHIPVGQWATRLGAEATRDFIARANTSEALGALAAEQGQAQPAIRYYRDAAYIYYALQKYEDEARVDDALGKVYEGLGDKTEAEHYYDRAKQFRRDRQ